MRERLIAKALKTANDKVFKYNNVDVADSKKMQTVTEAEVKNMLDILYVKSLAETWTAALQAADKKKIFEAMTKVGDELGISDFKALKDRVAKDLKLEEIEKAITEDLEKTASSIANGLGMSDFAKNYVEDLYEFATVKHFGQLMAGIDMVM